MFEIHNEIQKHTIRTNNYKIQSIDYIMNYTLEIKFKIQQTQRQAEHPQNQPYVPQLFLYSTLITLTTSFLFPQMKQMQRMIFLGDVFEIHEVLDVSSMIRHWIFSSCEVEVIHALCSRLWRIYGRIKEHRKREKNLCFMDVKQYISN